MFPSFAGTPEPEQTDVPFAYLTVKQLKRDDDVPRVCSLCNENDFILQLK